MCDLPRHIRPHDLQGQKWLSACVVAPSRLRMAQGLSSEPWQQLTSCVFLLVEEGCFTGLDK